MRTTSAFLLPHKVTHILQQHTVHLTQWGSLATTREDADLTEFAKLQVPNIQAESLHPRQNPILSLFMTFCGYGTIIFYDCEL